MSNAANAAAARATCLTGCSTDAARPQRRFPLTAIAAVLAAWLLAAAPVKAQDLPALAADLTRTTVSGLSSGGYMAGQFHIAYSDIVTGSAIIAGGPYGCARTPGSELNPFWMQQVLAWNLRRALQNCMDDGWWFYSTVPSPGYLYSYAITLARSGAIASLENLKDAKVYLFTSSEDETVHSGVVRAARGFYEQAGLTRDNIAFKDHDSAAHAFLTEASGLPCGETGPPFINDCDTDQAGAILNWLAGPLEPAGDAAPSGFIRFPQSGFIDDPGAASMAQEAMAYIPQSCRRDRGCAVHVVFHGCKQSLAMPEIGDIFVKQTGYARWAESNRLVLLFPQAAASTLNPNGCWDWWGYTGRKFLHRDAPQMSAVKAMLDRLGARPGW